MISYSINNRLHSVTFCKAKNLHNISESIESIKSDKNVLLIYDDSPFYKISPAYFDKLLAGKMISIGGSYVDKTVYDFIIGVGQSDGSSDFAWLLILRSMGVIFFITFIVWFFSKFSKLNFDPQRKNKQT